MQRFALVLAGSVLGACLLAWPATSQDQPSKNTASPTEGNKQVREILAAQGPSHAADGYSKLFKAANAEELRRLQLNASDTIAVQAAWEEIERSIPVKPEKVVRPDREKLARFLGFLEGRAHVRAPEWWAKSLLDARANRRGNVYGGGLNLAQPDGPKPDKPVLPRIATFDTKDGQPVVHVDTTFAAIPKNLREELKPSGLGDKVSALITPSHCYVAVYDDLGYPYRLACVERGSVKTRWVTEVWASWWGGISGVHHQWVEVVEQGNLVVTFGVASVGFHVEAFRVEDGVNTFRFSNSYSGW